MTDDSDPGRVKSRFKFLATFVDTASEVRAAGLQICQLTTTEQYRRPAAGSASVTGSWQCFGSCQVTAGSVTVPGRAKSVQVVIISAGAAASGGPALAAASRHQYQGRQKPAANLKSAAIRVMRCRDHDARIVMFRDTPSANTRCRRSANRDLLSRPWERPVLPQVLFHPVLGALDDG